MRNWFRELLILKKAIEVVKIQITVPLDTLETKKQRRKFRREHKN